VSRYQKGKTRKGKTNLDLLEQEIVSGSGICWAMCNAYSLQLPARSPLWATHGFTSSPQYTPAEFLLAWQKTPSLDCTIMVQSRLEVFPR